MNGYSKDNRKKCLYCEEYLHQHTDYKDCMNCKFPINGSIKDAIEFTEQKFKKAMKIYYIILPIVLIGLLIFTFYFYYSESTYLIGQEPIFQETKELKKVYDSLFVLPPIFLLVGTYFYLIINKNKKLKRLKNLTN